ncbi:unnamed protein product, partial [Pylaiella littoralis]
VSRPNAIEQKGEHGPTYIYFSSRNVHTLCASFVSSHTAPCMCMCIYSGNFDRSEYARKKGLGKKAGYITSVDDSKLEALIDIMRFFEKWRCNLEKTTVGDVTWKKHFITEYSWTKIRVSILGFVSMCRYLFEDDSRFKVSRPRDTPRYVNPRHHCQDVVENRFGHMRDGLGSH